MTAGDVEIASLDDTRHSAVATVRGHPSFEYPQGKGDGTHVECDDAPHHSLHRRTTDPLASKSETTRRTTQLALTALSVAELEATAPFSPQFLHSSVFSVFYTSPSSLMATNLDKLVRRTVAAVVWQ